MKTKLQYAKNHIDSLSGTLKCPICDHVLERFDNSVKCKNNHTYNINKKGVISFADPIDNDLYNTEMFEARQTVLRSHIFKPIMHTLSSVIKNDSTILDAGCGEGTYLNELYNESNRYIGVDLAKDGINIATNYNDVLWLLADLAHIPVNDQSVDVLLNILSPANYEEFNRILKDDGQFIKVIINKDYLKEIRMLTKQEDYDNTDVIELMDRHFEITSLNEIKYTVDIDKTLSEKLFKMTPLTKHFDYTQVLNQITIDLTIAIARKKRKI